MTGGRIRERRLDRQIKQADLARACGISSSYLNLIEHNRRRIGGKLLVDIARVLEVDAATLSRGAEAELIDTLRAVAAALPETGAEADRAEEIAGRFPGWSRLIEAQARRTGTLERTIETLTDRLTHDPFLSASLHDVLSTVTAIRSTSAILADDGEVDPEWQARFHRNLYEDSQRLAEASQALVTYLDAGGDAARGALSPQEELEEWLAGRDYHVAELERPQPPDIDTLVAAADVLRSVTARALAARYLNRYRAEAERVPLAALRDLVAEAGPDPAEISRRFAVDLGSAFRRLAALPTAPGEGRIGLVMCDGSGTLTFRKPVEGFSLPRFGAACPLWPLYQALARPMSPVRALVEQAGRPPHRFLTYAMSQTTHPAGFDGPAVFEAAMLILPEDRAPFAATTPAPIGTSCRICPRAACVARREPSILAEGF